MHSVAHGNLALVKLAPAVQLNWPRTYRLINSAYPPIDVFEDIAGPADWLLLSNAETKTNPRVADTIGQLNLIPPARRVYGAGASYVMAPFTHCSPDNPGRFHNGQFGAYYAGNSFEVAVAETVFHTEKFLSATKESAGWIAEKRELIGPVNAKLIDLRGKGFEDLLQPGSYTASQKYAADARNLGAQGIVFPSVRQRGGECFAAFWPDVTAIPVQGRHIGYHWNGIRIDYIRELSLDGTGQVFALEV